MNRPQFLFCMTLPDELGDPGTRADVQVRRRFYRIGNMSHHTGHLIHEGLRQHGKLEGGGVVFPKGVYQPTFQTEAGVYYEAPTFLVCTGLGARCDEWRLIHSL